MKKLCLSSLAAATLVFGGCASISTLPNTTPGQETAAVSIYRSDQLQGSMADVYIGWNDQYYLSLAPAEMTNVAVPAGLQTFVIRADADLPNELAREIKPSEQICLMAEVNPENIVGLNWFVPGYQLREVKCASVVEQNQFTKVTGNIVTNGTE